MAHIERFLKWFSHAEFIDYATLHPIYPDDAEHADQLWDRMYQFAEVHMKSRLREEATMVSKSRVLLPTRRHVPKVLIPLPVVCATLVSNQMVTFVLTSATMLLRPHARVPTRVPVQQALRLAVVV